MEANKTKEEILSKHSGIKIKYLIHCDVNGEIAMDAMDEYANQLLLEKDKENEDLKYRLDVSDTLKQALGMTVENLQSEVSDKDIKLQNVLRDLEAQKSVCNQLTEHIKHLEAELNEYKEKAILWDNLKTGDKLNSLVGGDSKFCEKVDKDKIKRLEAELGEKDKEIELLKIDLEIEKKKVLLNYESAVSFEKQVKQLQSELSEKDILLKEESQKVEIFRQRAIDSNELYVKLQSELSKLKEKRKEEIDKLYSLLEYGSTGEDAVDIKNNIKDILKTYGQ